MGELIAQALPLSSGAQELMECVGELCGTTSTTPGLNCWLLSLLECRGHLALQLAPSLIDPLNRQQELRQSLRCGDAGDCLSREEILTLANQCACNRGDETLTEHDLACVILTKAGYALDAQDAEALSDTDCETIYLNFDDDSEETLAPIATNTPLLDKLGIDLTRAAREGTLNPVVGREDEIQLIIETLCRRTKRNPALIGPAGVGKTAIVEGLARRIADGEVPAALGQLRIVMLSVTALVANCKLVGEFEERMTALITEASQPGIVLFIDEAHTMMGAGAAGRNDMANIIKPALARGTIACIAATTDEEYRLYIETDSALERRFQPVRVQELTPEQTLQVLTHLREQLGRQRGVEVPRALLEWIVNFAGQYLHNRFFPDKAVDVLEQCVAYGLTQGKTTLEQSDVEIIARRMVGMPLAVDERLAQLREELAHNCLLPEETTHALIQRLGVTLRGFDVNAARPNAVVLLLGDAETQTDLLCETMATCLFGAPDRVVTFDFARFLSHADITMLVGSPPGYIGYEGRVSLHQVLQMPWCVLRCENLHAAHPSAREILTQGLRSGVITLADGKRVFLSDTLVVLTADVPTNGHGQWGFEPAAMPPVDLREKAAGILGPELVSQADITCFELCTNRDAQRHWLEETLLHELSERFRAQGVCLCYDASLFPWLLSRGSLRFTQTDWERLIDQDLCPLILPHLPATRPRQELLLRLTIENGACVVERRSDC